MRHWLFIGNNSKYSGCKNKVYYIKYILLTQDHFFFNLLSKLQKSQVTSELKFEVRLARG